MWVLKFGLGLPGGQSKKGKRKVINYEYHMVLKEKADQLLRRDSAFFCMDLMWVMQRSTSSTASSLFRQGRGLWKPLHWKSGPWPGEGTSLEDPEGVDQMCNPPMTGYIQQWHLDSGRMQGPTPASSPNYSPCTVFLLAHSLRLWFPTKTWNAGFASAWEVDLDI